MRCNLNNSAAFLENGIEVFQNHETKMYTTRTFFFLFSLSLTQY